MERSERLKRTAERKRKRPEIVINVFSSLDGRITTAPGRNVAEWTAAGLDGDANRIAHELYDHLECDGLVGGSDSLLVFGNHWVELETPVPWPQKSRAFIVLDGKGRIQWSQTDGLLVLTREDVSPDYIGQLENKGIEYIQVGTGAHIDLGRALEILYEKGFRRLGITGGGALNGAFLRQGLVDEISVILAPVVVGGHQTPTLFDAPDLQGLDGLTQLDLLQTKPVGDGCVWTHYRVKND
jgi:riboflavin biosynthesis pyrimidine reductase